MMRLTDRKEAIRYIAEVHQGTKEDLIAQIGKDLYEQFSRMGFIKRGISPNAGKFASTWQITELGKKQEHFYRSPNEQEKELGRYYHSLGI